MTGGRGPVEVEGRRICGAVVDEMEYRKSIVLCPFDAQSNFSDSSHLRDSLSFHAEPFDDPIAAAQGALQAIGDGVGADALGNVELGGTVSLRWEVKRVNLSFMTREEIICMRHRREEQ